MQPQPSKKEALKQTQTELQNIQMAARVSQMMIQQLMQNVKSMSEDLGSALNQLYEMQYKYAALQKHLSIDSAALDVIANELRLKDFESAAVKADEKENLEVADIAQADSTVTITSTATDSNGQDRGIFRSRIKLSESGVPDLINNLTGKKVGEKVAVKLNDVDHIVELLAIRNPKAVEQVVQEVTH
jgi:hypothetical protein